MIYGSLKNIEAEYSYLPEAILKGLRFIRDTDLESLEYGSHELQGRDIFVQVMDKETKAYEECLPEVHVKYIDIHTVAYGTEKFGFANETGNNKVKEDLLAERDLLFYENCENENFVTINKDDFVLVFPKDVHRPAGAVDKPMNIKKIVVKIKMDLIK